MEKATGCKGLTELQNHWAEICQAQAKFTWIVLCESQLCSDVDFQQQISLTIWKTKLIN